MRNNCPWYCYYIATILLLYCYYIATILHKFLEGMEYPLVPVWNMLYNYLWYCYWNILLYLLYLSGICCITISGTATGISSCISCTCLECVEHQTLVLGCKAISCTCQNIRTSEHQTLVLGCKTISPEEQQQQQQLQPQLQL